MNTKTLTICYSVLFTPSVFGDQRNLFKENYKARNFTEATRRKHQFVLDNVDPLAEHVFDSRSHCQP